jgi:hypothetical protein
MSLERVQVTAPTTVEIFEGRTRCQLKRTFFRVKLNVLHFSAKQALIVRTRYLHVFQRSLDEMIGDQIATIEREIGT